MISNSAVSREQTMLVDPRRSIQHRDHFSVADIGFSFISNDVRVANKHANHTKRTAQTSNDNQFLILLPAGLFLLIISVIIIVNITDFTYVVQVGLGRPSAPISHRHRAQS